MMPDETGGASQRRQILGSLVIAAQYAYIHMCKTKIGRHFYMGYAHESDPGIFDFPADNVD
jgi:hypothetical protein